MAKSSEVTNPVVEEKKEKKEIAGLKQTEITIIEERLSMPFGALPIDIAQALSNRFDGCLDKVNKATSKLIYAEAIKDDGKRKKEIADIMKEIKTAKEERQKKIWNWYPKVIAYIKEVYGKEIRDGNGTVLSYGDRVEVNKKNKNLKKIW